MSPVSNPRVIFSKRISGVPVPGEHLVYDDSQTIDVETVPLNGGYLTKTLVLSPEPYMRERMRDPSIASYSNTMKLGQPVVGSAVVVVLRSEDPNVKPGDHMVGYSPWEAYTVQPYPRDPFEPKVPYEVDMNTIALRVVQNPGLPWTNFTSALGTPGLTAWCGLEAFANSKPGEVIFVSSGASGVGQIVIQFAKIRGLKVIASAGSSEKVAYMTELGADVAFNYKETAAGDVLKKHGPVDIYWDNVGGETLETAITHAAYKGRIISCGSISEYNVSVEERYGIKNISEIWKRRITIHGLMIGEFLSTLAPRFYTEVPALLAQGKIKMKEEVTRGLENAIETFLRLLSEGGTLGKPVVVVSDG